MSIFSNIKNTEHNIFIFRQIDVCIFLIRNVKITTQETNKKLRTSTKISGGFKY